MRGSGRALSWRDAGAQFLPAFLSRMRAVSLRPFPPRSAPMRVIGIALVLTFAAAALVTMLNAGGLRSFLALPQGRIVAPAGDPTFGWIARATAECDAEAARNPDTLYFIVIPVVATDGNVQAWLAKANGMVAQTLVLLGSKTTIEGLRAGSLRLDGRAFEFAVLDPGSADVYKWKSAVGVHKFAIRDAKRVTSFRPGFELAKGTETQWADGGAIPRAAGTCYWTGALMPG
jgi:hypothetical protein